MNNITKYILFIIAFTSGHATYGSFGNHSGINKTPQNQGISVVANNDVISMNENATWIANVTNNDYGLQNGISQLTITTAPRNGVAKVLDDNTISYTPDESFFGTDRLVYRVCNTQGNCDEAEVNIVVSDVDYTPKLLNDTVIYYTDSSSVFKVLINDKDLYDKPLNMNILQDLNNGFSEITSQMSIKLTFTSYFYTTDSLIYQVCDNDGDCDQATLFVKPPRETDQPYVIPEAFSPNGDGFNDTFWIPQYDYYQNLSFIVYNRNGMKVFEESNYENNWDGFANTGELKGNLVPRGIYFYVLTVTGSSETTKGSVYISY
ncbi:gliding motility-associated C-terminal domain-containing protein [Marinilabilia salmonicolor]|jgi:gliding motility-associated-like protein|uniref:Gliding motility-associated-like protein n=1 Tax=Marinilabilia salmonicolor TaxID=989 RepID=A0A2T0XBV2_9BACT|nr:gliding motility-associated C-terminal domain-containing protein [Marinilabilia salmonicolor]PRY96379.1 gliding motility-associated-like protein [Marinilabilia salmonicolor]RCW37554.1 gliding motility-associated-like protein [Marinilabilia salmonicolor]